MEIYKAILIFTVSEIKFGFGNVGFCEERKTELHVPKKKNLQRMDNNQPQTESTCGIILDRI